MPFTAAEWEEMRRADEEIEREFRLSPEDLERDRELTQVVKLERMAPEKRRIAAYQRAYYEANRDSIAAYQRAYREANRDSLAEKQRAYYEANRDSIAEKQRAYREANRDSIAEKQRAYYEANRDSIAEKQRAYREANRDSIAEKQRWIREARKAHGYTQRDMARMLGVSISAISRLESGELRLSGFKKRVELLALLKEGGDVSMQ